MEQDMSTKRIEKQDQFKTGFSFEAQDCHVPFNYTCIKQGKTTKIIDIITRITKRK